ncbi:hypothetical protein HDU78_009833, partial [Chytriomyces hyalinus]
MATQLTCSVEEVALAEDGSDTELQVVRRLVLHLEFDVATGQITTTTAPQPPPRNNSTSTEQPQIPSTATSEWTILRGKPLSVHASVSLDPRVFQVGMRFYRAESEEDKLRIIGFGVLSLDQLVSRMQDIVATAALNYASISHPQQQQPENDNNNNTNPNENMKDISTPNEYHAQLQDLESDTEMIQLLFTAIKQNQNLETKLRTAEKQRVETLQKLSLMQKRLEKETERVVKCSEK